MTLGRKKRKKLPTMLVVRLKPNGVVKARMFARGDCMRGGSFSQFLSAPTGGRALIRVLISLDVQYKYALVSCDISHAFLQADELTEDEKYLATPLGADLCALQMSRKERIEIGLRPYAINRCTVPLMRPFGGI